MALRGVAGMAAVLDRRLGGWLSWAADNGGWLRISGGCLDNCEWRSGVFLVLGLMGRCSWVHSRGPGGHDLLACGWGWDVAGFLGRGAICFHRSEA